MIRTVCGEGRRLEYILIRSQRRDVLLQALPEGKTRVYAPSYMHLRDVDALVRSRMEELTQMHAALEHQLAENLSLIHI